MISVLGFQLHIFRQSCSGKKYFIIITLYSWDFDFYIFGDALKCIFANCSYDAAVHSDFSELPAILKRILVNCHNASPNGYGF